MTTRDAMSGGDALAAGTRLEEFEIERELGAGGFGVTYLAHDRSLERRVAIKEYLPRDWGTRGPEGGVGPRSASDAKDYRWGLERFLKEARALARLRHAHILHVYQVIEARGTAYMVTEYVEGRSLAAALRAEGPWPEARVMSLLDALTSGLAAVHGAGLVHRDVKPANVMLRDDGSPVLIDFGAVRRAAGGRSGSLLPVLTPGYAPLEQYTEKGVLGPWTDVYALGAVAYEALSGRVPEEAPGRVAEDGLRPVAEAAPRAVSARVSSAVMSALALLREDRPQSLAEWRGLLGLPAATGTAGDAGAGAAPVPAGAFEPSGPVPRRASGPVGAPRRRPAAAALVVLALGGAGAAWWFGGAAAPPESTGTVARAPVGEDAVGAALGDGGGRGESGGSADVTTLHAAAETAEAERQRLAELRRPGRVFRDCDSCPELVVIPAGEFQMGSSASEEGRSDNEGPLRRVVVGSFALGRREVTRSEYAAFVTATGRGSGGGCAVFTGSNEWSPNAERSWREPGFAQGGDHPVVCVNWEDARAYAAWLSGETGKSYRLPSESEWEYAARAGTTTARYWGAGSDAQCGYANGADAALKSRFNSRTVAGCDDGAVWTAPAGSYGANDFRLFDMLGNLWEWVEDCWHEDYSGAPSDGTAWTIGGDCGNRVLRGGAWETATAALRSAERMGNHSADVREDHVGFRVARTLD